MWWHWDVCCVVLCVCVHVHVRGEVGVEVGVVVGGCLAVCGFVWAGGNHPTHSQSLLQAAGEGTVTVIALTECTLPGSGGWVMVCVWCGKQAKRGGRVAVSKLRAGGNVKAGSGGGGKAGAGAGGEPKCKCKHLPSIREKAVMAALAKLAVGDLAFCDVRVGEAMRLPDFASPMPLGGGAQCRCHVPMPLVGAGW